MTASRDYYFPNDLGYSFFSSSCVVILFKFSCLWSKLEFGGGDGGWDKSTFYQEPSLYTLWQMDYYEKRGLLDNQEDLWQNHYVSWWAQQNGEYYVSHFKWASDEFFMLDIFQVGQVHAPRSSGWLVSSVHLYCLWNEELPNSQTNHIDQAESDWHQVSQIWLYHMCKFDVVGMTFCMTLYGLENLWELTMVTSSLELVTGHKLQCRG